MCIRDSCWRGGPLALHRMCRGWPAGPPLRARPLALLARRAACPAGAARRCPPPARFGCAGRLR
eukprot:9266183-Alexandrium_andersonii.AAC.1